MPDARWSDLIIYESGSLDAFEDALRSRPRAIGLALNLQDEEGNLPEEKLRRSPDLLARVEFMDRFLEQSEALSFLDDYIDALVRWGLSPGSAGVSLREALAYRDEVSGWWLLRMAEKDIHSVGAQAFRAIWLIDRWMRDAATAEASPPSRAIWIGDAFIGEAVRRFLAVRGFALQSFESRPPSSAQASRPARSGPIGAFAARVRQARQAALSAAEALSQGNDFGKRSSRRLRALVVSEFPASWRREELELGDRYMQAIAEALKQELGEQAQLGLLLRVGPASSTEGRSALRRTKDAFAQRGLPAPRLLDARNSWQNRWKARAWAKSAFAKLERGFRRSEFARIVYRGADLSDLFERRLLEEIRSSAAPLLEQGLNLSDELRRLQSPLVVFRNEFYADGRMISWACDRARCPSFSIQHGNVSRRHGVYRPHRLETADGPYAAPMPSAFGVWNDQVRSMLAERAPGEAHRFLEIGALASTLAKPIDSWLNRASARAELGWNDQPTWVFFAQGAMTMQNCRILLDAWNDFGPDAHRLVIKPHPRDGTVEILRGLLETRPWASRATTFTTAPLEQLLPAANACITCYSTVGYEAIRLGRPLLVLRRSDDRGYGAFEEFSSLARVAGNRGEALEEIRRIAKMPEFRSEGGLGAGSAQASMRWLYDSSTERLIAAARALAEASGKSPISPL